MAQKSKKRAKARKPAPDAITQFLERYRREYDYWSELSRLCAERCEKDLENAGIRAIVTWRAKRPDKLAKKVRKRATERASSRRPPYSSVEDIYKDIVDLAGVRIALYFPADRKEVDRLIRDAFDFSEDPKDFPGKNPRRSGVASKYLKKFSGYAATHYRVRLRPTDMSDPRFSDARIEIQIASVLMHAWAEVEHDLVYKPESGELSKEEHATLDEINGLVLAGEIALECLQDAFRRRVLSQDRAFTNHYELASYLYDHFRSVPHRSGVNPVMGRVDVLFALLRVAKFDRLVDVRGFVEAVDDDTEQRALAEQIVDQVLVKRPDLYPVYQSIRKDLDRATETSAISSDSESLAKTRNLAFADFIHAWIEFERTYMRVAGVLGAEKHAYNYTLRFMELSGLSPTMIMKIMNVRRLRNGVLHGVEVPDTDTLRAATNDIISIVGSLNERYPIGANA